MVTGPSASAATAVMKRDVVPASPAWSRAAPPTEPSARADDQRAVAADRQGDPEPGEALGHRRGVVPGGHTGQLAVPLGQGGADQRPVGDALRARHLDDRVERTRRGPDAPNLGHPVAQPRRATAGRNPRAINPPR